MNIDERTVLNRSYEELLVCDMCGDQLFGPHKIVDDTGFICIPCYDYWKEENEIG